MQEAIFGGEKGESPYPIFGRMPGLECKSPNPLTILVMFAKVELVLAFGRWLRHGSICLVAFGGKALDINVAEPTTTIISPHQLREKDARTIKFTVALLL